jgi:3-mercaptopyruvate sulfurtransferase SseA
MLPKHLVFVQHDRSVVAKARLPHAGYKGSRDYCQRNIPAAVFVEEPRAADSKTKHNEECVELAELAEWIRKSQPPGIH